MDVNGPEEQSREREVIGTDALAFLETLQSTAPMGVGFVDRSFRYVRVNEALASINGPSVKEHIGRSVADVVPRIWPAFPAGIGAA